jgi:FkbM family methyltransferase
MGNDMGFIKNNYFKYIFKYIFKKYIKINKMLIPLDYLVKKYNIIFKGVLHVGAHECEELTDYLKYLPVNKILWIEALHEKVVFCKEKYPNLLIENAIVSDKIEKITFNVSNNGQSSSILNFGLHSTFHPHVKYVYSFEGESKLLKDILPKYPIEYNFLNFDIQGAELKALKGMDEYLNKVDYLYTEVNSDYVYKDCALVSELDKYLEKFDLIRVETKWTNFRWGDAFYIKNNLLTH